MVRKPAFFAVLLTLFVGVAAVRADQRGPKLDRALREVLASGRHGTHTVIIQMRPGVRSALRKALLDHGDVVRAEHPSIDAITVDVHSEDLAALANDPAVASVSLDAPVVAHAAHGPQTLSDRALKYYSALRSTLGLTGSTSTGEGVGVAVIDSGIQPSVDFDVRIAAFYDFTRGGPVPTFPYDDFGHGTHVAGLIGSSGASSRYQYMGVAPRVRLIGLKVLDGNGRGTTSGVLSAVDFAVANRARFGIDVINISLGHPILESAATDPLVRAVERAAAAGIVVVVSAGNCGVNPETDRVGYAGITSPGNAPSAVTVGAAQTRGTIERGDDRVTEYSSRGPSWYDAFAKPDVVAPGDKLISNAAFFSTLYEGNPTLREKGKTAYSYFTLSGTSMSAAVASGVVALMLEQSRASNPGEPAITPNAVKAILQYSSITVTDDTGAAYDALTQGAGSLNAGGALALAAAFDTSALAAAAGTPVIDSTVAPFTTIGGQAVEWSRNIVWGTNLVSQAGAIWNTNIVWGTNVVWGTALDPDNIVWGTVADLDNIVWGTSVDWVGNVVWGSSVLTTTDGQNVVWGTALDPDNIVWGTLADVWMSGDAEGENVVWGMGWHDGDNIVWGTRGEDGDNIVWGTRRKKEGR